ncbi:uncharacterized protein LOC107369322 [Tetranychus urticae]|uniref:uncharacterized protein LOC107369322 n=1 Tax=Tetranychus urticae TaxID=32264 RepID=UPI00077B98FB|nr:uncharacterized protein LOC107369322 [Tetranychus urticae]
MTRIGLPYHFVILAQISMYSPPSFTTSSAQPLLATDSFLDDYIDSEDVSRSSGARDAYGNQLSQGYAGSGYKAADSSSGRLSSGSKGHQSHIASSKNKESDGSVKHSEGSIEAEKDKVVKHQWDRGSGYVKEWNWDKGVHYEKESGSLSASDLKHKESERMKEAAEKEKGSAGWQQHKNSDHEKWRAANGYDKKGYRNEDSKGYSDKQGSTGYKKYGSSDDPWNGGYIPLKAAASAVNQPTSYNHPPHLPYNDRRYGYSERPGKVNHRDRTEYNNSLRELIEKKYMPIYRRYSLAAKREDRKPNAYSKKNQEPNRRYPDLRLALSKEFLGPQGRWKLGHLFGNGLDAFSPSSRFIWQ